MMSGERRVFTIAILLSLALHLFLITRQPELFKEGNSAGISIPVTLSPELVRHPRPEPRKAAPKSIPLNPEQGEGGFTRSSTSELVDKYLLYLREAVEKNKYQPPQSRYYRLIGNTTVAFDILADGTFQHIRTLRSSGDELLDRTALKAIAFTNGTYKRPTWSGRQVLHVSFILKYQYGL